MISQPYYGPLADTDWNFSWDGLDQFGSEVFVPQEAEVKLITNYAGHGDIPFVTKAVIGTWIPKNLGLGGWTLDINHFYSPITKAVYFGYGSARLVSSAPVLGNYLIPAEDGSEVYVFDLNGRHLLTRFGLTGATKFAFAYDTQGRISTVTDPYGRVTTFNRSSGILTSITTHYGQTT